jgi:two-component system sensor histidine kinase TctE
MPPSPIEAGAHLPAGSEVGFATQSPPALGASARGKEARSLFGEILDWMFAPLLLLWPMSVTLTYLVAQSIASSPYDRVLIERGEALAAHVRFDGGRARFDLTAGLLDIYGNGMAEGSTYLVATADGAPLAGDADLPRPPGLPAGAADANNGRFALRRETLRGHPVCVAYTWVAAPAASGAPPVLVAVAEPPTERTELANEIVKGVILPQFVVLPLALLLVWFGLTRGLAPLERLQLMIRNRPPDDLSPISAESAPEELSPLLASFNALLGRMALNLEVQKRFIADAAHQMKTPLAGLRTQTELAQRAAEAPHEVQHSLRLIAASTNRATRLVNQLLAMARAEHGAVQRVAMVRVDLDRLAREVVQDWVPPAMSQHIDLGYEGPPPGGIDGSCEMLGSPLLLHEMLDNLIDNALRYTAGHAADAAAGALPVPGRPLGTITVRVHRDGRTVTLEVEDSGPGIAPEERGRIFERFYRVLGSRQDGSGLGLAIVREIAVQHFASVVVTDPPAAPAASASAMRRGALFRVRFPVAPDAPAGATGG